MARCRLTAVGTTAVAHLALVLVTGSVALLGDTVHNFADALTAVPLGVAFRWAGGRRPGRAEDLAGVVVVLVVAASAAIAGYASVVRLLEPRPVGHPWTEPADRADRAHETLAHHR